MEPHARIDHPGGIAVLAIVILVLSNLASNVPTGKLNYFLFNTIIYRAKHKT